MSQFTYHGKVAIRLDRFLKDQLPQLSMTLIRQTIAAGKIKLPHQPTPKKSTLIHPGSRIDWPDLADISQLPISNATIELTLCYEDDDYLVVDKPAGLASVPLHALDNNSLANALVARYPQLRGASPKPLDAGLLQRLDTHTSGVILVAKQPDIWHKTRKLFQQKQVVKEYRALVEGKIASTMTMDQAICHDTQDRRKMRIASATQRSGQRLLPALSHVTPLQHFKAYTLVKVIIATGVMHQIRVHLQHAGHPIVGDSLYGHASPELSRYFLHACRLQWQHPVTARNIEVSSDLPPALNTYLRRLERGDEL